MKQLNDPTQIETIPTFTCARGSYRVNQFIAHLDTLIVCDNIKSITNISAAKAAGDFSFHEKTPDVHSTLASGTLVLFCNHTSLLHFQGNHSQWASCGLFPDD
jgi:methylaspartate ammonia-lyase